MAASEVPDWNSALADLDRGLRSTVAGEQAEAIAKVPLFFQDNPFPIFINATFIKLAEVFRQGPNFLRTLVIDVVEHSQVEILKVISKDDILRRIFTVSFSNDPIARSLTLSVLGAMGSIYFDRQNVHDFIRRSLDSHNVGELTAAIKATKRYAEVSREFYDSIFDKVSDALDSPSYSPEMKKQFLTVLGSFSATHMVRLWHKGSSDGGTQQKALLKLITEMRLRGAVDIPIQISLYLNILEDNACSEPIKRLALHGLRRVTLHSAHLWSAEQVATLQNLISTQYLPLNSPDLLVLALRALATLCKCRPVIAMFSVTDTLMLVQTLLLDQSDAVKELAMLIFGRIVGFLLSVCEYAEFVDTSLPTLLHYFRMFFSRPGMRKCLVDIASRRPSFARSVMQSFLSQMGGSSKEELNHLLETMAILIDMYPDLVQLDDLEQLRLVCPRNRIGVAIYVGALRLLPDEQTHERCEALSALVASETWSAYCLARTYMRNGIYDAAAQLLERLGRQVSSETCRSWIIGLQSLCDAEVKLRSSGGKSFGPMKDAYLTATTWFTAASSKNEGGSFSFAVEWSLMRMHSIGALAHASLVVQHAYCLPPDFVKHDFESCVRRLQQVATRYEWFRRMCFDADRQTLMQLSLFSALHNFAACALAQCLQLEKSEQQCPITALPDAQRMNRCNRLLLHALQRFNDTVQQHECTPQQFVEALGVALITYCPAPRFLFQSLQHTIVKLAISPKTTFNLPLGQQLVLKTEGMIDNAAAKQRLREVSEVKVRLTALGEDRSEETQLAEKTISNNGGYFAGEFLLNVQESCTVNVGLELLDSEYLDMWVCRAHEELKVTVVGGSKVKKQKTLD